MAVKAAPGADRIYGICLVHLILCIAIIAATTPGSSSLSLGGVLIAPTLQWWNSAFAALSIAVIILAAVGVLYLVEWHLDVYVTLLVASIAIDLLWFGTFLFFGSSCTSGAPTSCSVSSGGVILGITVIVIFKIFALWAVIKAKRAVRIKYNEELLPYLRKNLSTTIGGGDALEGGAVGMPGGENSLFKFGAASGLANTGVAGASAGGSGGAGGSNGRSGKSVSFAAAPEVVNIGGPGSCNGSPVATAGYGATSNANPQQWGISDAAPCGPGPQPCAGISAVPPYASGANSSYYGCAVPATTAGMYGMCEGGAAPMAISSRIAPMGGTPAGTPMGSMTAVPAGAVPGVPPGSLVVNTPGGVTVPIPLPPEPVPQVAVPPPTYASAPPEVLQSMASLPPTPVAVSMPGSGTVLLAPSNPAEQGGAEAVFDQIDKDGDGVITREEWQRFRSGAPRSPSGSSDSLGSDSSG